MQKKQHQVIMNNKRYILFKYAFERLIALLAIIFLLPVFLLLAVLVKLSSNGPVFFIQTRVGENGKMFPCLKFRTMYVGTAPKVRADGTVITEANDPRITPVGKWLRFGIDELPQLFNILRGEMTLIAPRPDLPYMFLEADKQKRLRYTLRPGISNLPAVMGRNALDMETRIALDLYYVNNVNFKLDAIIFIYTLLMPFGLKPKIKAINHIMANARYFV